MSSTSNMRSLSLTDPKRVIPGLVYVANPRPWWVPVGLEETQGPNAKPSNYRPVSFAADREYGPDEGWQMYRTRRERRWMKRRSRNTSDDTYDFDDDDY